MTVSWDRQADETEEWYDRFMLYLYMGPDRTVADAHRFATRLTSHAAHGQHSRHSNHATQVCVALSMRGIRLGSWHRAARRHQWKARAAAFDADLCRKMLGNNATAGDGTGDAKQSGWSDEERLRMVAELLRQVYGVLRHADLLTLSKEEARQRLPTLRLFFRDLLQLHQSEVAQLLAGSEGKEGSTLSADDFAKFMTEGGGFQIFESAIQRLTDTTTHATQAYVASTPSETSWRPLRDVLAQLYSDETSARRIADQAHLDSARIQFSARAVDNWHAILTEAAHMGLLESVIEAVREEYGANPELVEAVLSYGEARAQEDSQVGLPKRAQEKQVKKGRVRRKA